MPVHRSFIRLAPLALMLSIACSARVDLDDDGNGGSGGDGGAGEGGSGGNTNPECLPFHDAEPLSALTIRFVNQTGQDVIW